MIKMLINYFHLKLGVDSSIFWGVLNKGFGFIRGPISIYFLIKYLTPEDQGLWYTFGSLSALTIFAELGFTSIITQFVSHEFAKVENKERIDNSNGPAIDRLMGLIRFAVKFYFVIIPTAILILVTVGYFYFRTESVTIYIAWFIFSMVGGLSLFIGLLQSVYQGLDKVKEIQINIFLSTVINTLISWGLLMMNLRIWALVLGNLLGLMISSYFLFKTAPNFWKLIYQYNVQKKYNFFAETMPLQAKYAITWASSYFISYLYVPATYKLVGEIQAGQLGVTISIFIAISGVANNWVFTKVPKFNILVSKKDYVTLNNLFKRSTFQGLFVLVLLLVMFLVCIFLLQIFLPNVSQRFLSIKLTFLLMLPQISQYFIGVFATYLRAHKEEPFMWVSVLTAILLLTTVFGVLSSGLGLEVLFYSLNIIYGLIILPLSLKIFIDKRKLYLAKYY